MTLILLSFLLAGCAIHDDSCEHHCAFWGLGDCGWVTALTNGMANPEPVSVIGSLKATSNGVGQAGACYQCVNSCQLSGQFPDDKAGTD